MSIEEILNERERRRVLNNEQNQCPLLDEKYKYRICPADGKSKCKDCPF